MSALTDTIAIRDAAASKLAALLAADTLHPNHSEGGRSIDHVGLMVELRTQIKEAQLLIIQLRGPVEISQHLIS